MKPKLKPDARTENGPLKEYRALVNGDVIQKGDGAFVKNEAGTQEFKELPESQWGNTFKQSDWNQGLYRLGHTAKHSATTFELE